MPRSFALELEPADIGIETCCRIDDGGLTFAGTARLLLLTFGCMAMALIVHGVYVVRDSGSTDQYRLCYAAPRLSVKQAENRHLFLQLFFRLSYKGAFAKLQLTKPFIEISLHHKAMLPRPSSLSSSLPDYGIFAWQSHVHVHTQPIVDIHS